MFHARDDDVTSAIAYQLLLSGNCCVCLRINELTRFKTIGINNLTTSISSFESAMRAAKASKPTPTP